MCKSVYDQGSSTIKTLSILANCHVLSTSNRVGNVRLVAVERFLDQDIIGQLWGNSPCTLYPKGTYLRDSTIGQGGLRGRQHHFIIRLYLAFQAFVRYEHL